MYLEVRPTCADGPSQCHEPQALLRVSCVSRRQACRPASISCQCQLRCLSAWQPKSLSLLLPAVSLFDSSTPSPTASLQQLIFCRPGRPHIAGSIAVLQLPLEHFTSACLHQATVRPRQPQVQKPYPSFTLPRGRCVCVHLLPPHHVTTHLPTRICGYQTTSPESEAKIYVFANFQIFFFSSWTFFYRTLGSPGGTVGKEPAC